MNFRPLKIFLSFIVFYYLSSPNTNAQNDTSSVSRVVYLTGNTSGADNTENLSALHAAILKETAPVILIYNGDILHKHGLDGKATGKDSAFIRLLLDAVKDVPNALVYFTPGDLDWDNSGEDGWKNVKKLEALINGIAGNKIFLPETGCPGPVTIDAGKKSLLHSSVPPGGFIPMIVLMLLQRNAMCWWRRNSLRNWKAFLKMPEKKMCSSPDIIRSFPMATMEVGLRSHSIFHLPLSAHLRLHITKISGHPKTIAYPAYQVFATDLKNLMQDYSPFIYASAHDYNLQVLGFEKSYQVVSGSITKKVSAGKSDNTVYKSNENGFIKLSYYNDGKVIMDAVELSEGKILATASKELYQSSCHPDQSGAPVNTRFIPCKEKIAPAEHMNPAFADSLGTAVAGPEYKASFIKESLSRFTISLQLDRNHTGPLLNLDTTRMGLTATGKGGGRQTHSLSLDGGDGKSYVFRSVDKDPIKALDPRLKKNNCRGFVPAIDCNTTSIRCNAGFIHAGCNHHLSCRPVCCIFFRMIRN
jgi:hypothetical protein